MAQPSFAIADAARADLEALLEQLNERVRKLLLKLATKDGVLVRDDLANTARVRTQVLKLLADAGATGVVDTLETAAAQEAARMLSTLPGDKTGFAAEAGPELDAIVAGQTKDVAGAFRAARADIRKAINRGVSSGAPLDDLISRVADKFSTTFLRASSAVDTAIIGTGRSVLVTQTERASDATGLGYVFRYVGPLDGKTRAFCRELLAARDTVYTKAGMDSLDNGPGQPMPVSTFGGGYNCRHTWAPIPRAQAEDRGLTIVEG